MIIRQSFGILYQLYGCLTGNEPCKVAIPVKPFVRFLNLLLTSFDA